MRNDQPETIKVYFEVTNFCNFNCDFCPSGVSKRPRQHMDFALFQKGIDEIAAAKLAYAVGFHLLGEPLLYPRIFEALGYAKSHGLRTEVNTNGSLLTEDRIERLVRARLDQLAISVQIIGEEEHRCRGSKMPFREYYQGVMQAVARIQQSRSQMDVVLCLMNTSTRRFFDVDRLMRMGGKGSSFRKNLVRFILDLRAAIGKEVSPATVKAALSRFDLNRPQFLRIDEHVVVYAQPFADWGNAFTSRRIYPAKVGFCAYGLTNVGVLSNGEVTICCADYDGHTSLGNLRDTSLAALLSSEQAQRIREGFSKMRLVHPYCQRCVGSPSRIKALVKGLGSIYLFKLLQFQPARVQEALLIPA